MQWCMEQQLGVPVQCPAADLVLTCHPAQVLWALATLRRADKPLLDAATRALASKAAGADSADVAAALWGLASLGHVVDNGTLRKAAAAVAAGGWRGGMVEHLLPLPLPVCACRESAME